MNHDDEWESRALALAEAGHHEEASRCALAALQACHAAADARAEAAVADWAARHDAAALRREREGQQEAAATAERARAVQADLRQALLRIEQMGRRIGAERELRPVLARIDECAAELMQAPRRATWLFDESRAALRLAAGSDRGRTRRRDRVSLHEPWSAVARCARLGRELVVHGAEPFGDAPPAQAPQGTTLLWPLKAESRLVGVLELGLPDRAVLDARQRSLFTSFCAFAAVALANARTWSALSRSRARLAASERAARRARRDAAQHAARQTGAMLRLSALLGEPVARLVAALDTLGPAPAQCASLDEALAHHARAVATACEALDLTRLEAGCIDLLPEPFPIDELLTDAVAAFRLRRPGLPVHLPPGGPACTVRADVAALDRTLATLLDALAAQVVEGEALQVALRVESQRVRLHFTIAGRTDLVRPPPDDAMRLRLAVARELVALHGEALRTVRRGRPGFVLGVERDR